jgi:hypothetical protein
MLCLAPAGHDADGDLIDDACDACPQLVDDQRDSDGDDVGDACDPFTTREQRTLFDPFIGPRADWVYDPRTEFVGDSLSLPAIDANLGIVLADPPGRMIIEVGGRVGAGGSGSRQIAMHVGGATTPAHYYCELYDSGAQSSLQLTYTLDDTSYTNLDVAAIGGGQIEHAAFRLIFEHRPPDLGCVAWWNGVRYEVRATDPGGIPVERTIVRVLRLDAQLDYFDRLATP